MCPGVIPRDFLLRLFDVAVSAALPQRVLAAHLPDPPAGRTLVLGAGKASAAMAAAVENHWAGDLAGLVITRDGHRVPTRRVEVVEAAHPVPDARGVAATRRVLALASAAGADDLVICLISGGASSLLTLPAPGISLAQKQRVNEMLLRCGAPIDAMNVVRKCLSAVKGGRLGAAIAPAASLTLLISDVPGDAPAVIGSGPTVADSDATAQAAFAIARRYGLELDAAVREAMTRNPAISSLPPNQRVVLTASPGASLKAAAASARAQGVAPVVLGDAIEGEARVVAREMAQIVRAWHGKRPCVLLSGGETTVTLTDAVGRGGRNAEFLLALCLELGGCPGVFALACDTDGIDGSEDNAGALVDPTSLQRARDRGVDALTQLNAHDAYGFFQATDDLVVTGPTFTNVNDFRAIYLP